MKTPATRPACLPPVRWMAAFFLVLVPSQRVLGIENAPLPGSKQAEFFETKIRPVLIEHCYGCHNSAENADGGLALDHRSALLKGGDSGLILKPGDPGSSRLLSILKHEVDGLEMPQGGPKLDDSIIGDFERWIASGAYDPRDSAPDADALASMQSWEAVLERRKGWWSFQPVVDHQIPSLVMNRGNAEPGLISHHPIDRFIYAKLAETEIVPNAPVDAATLVRRLYFALTGLPPTVQQSREWTTRIEAAGSLGRDSVIETLVDQLLASRQFGHRWARHWMDWIRYAESHGSEGDPVIDNAWMYRDYLIRAFNEDISIDQLIREHIAGDLLDTPRIHPTDRFNESIIGTSHWRMVFHGFAPTDALEERVRFTDDQINAFTKAFLGMTVSCARCHNHKFDAISQADYYALYGVLNSCRPGRATIDLPEDQDRHRPELTELKKQIKTEVTDVWLESLDTVPQRIENKLSAAAGEFAADSLLGIYRKVLQTLQSNPSEIDPLWQRLRHEHLDSEDDTIPTVELTEWFRYGNGLSHGVNASGEFTLFVDGEAVISDIYPSGTYSHLISSKHAARLTSPNIRLDDDYEVWAEVIGGGGASIRYVVQNYPRNGTVYPVVTLKPQWHWQRFDLQYWKGDDIHIELTSAKDAPLLVGQEPRSWFGIRKMQLVPKGESKRRISDQGLSQLLAWRPNAPATMESFRVAVVESLRESIRAWRDDKINDRQALLLNHCLQEGLLVNRLADLAKVDSLVNRYRQLEAEIPVPRRVPSLDEAASIDQPLMIRGNHKTLGPVIPRRFLEAIDPTPYATATIAANGQKGGASGRLQLADDLLRDNNPLTRRVLVNRIWHHLFGRGIVASTDNFGRLGDTPTHPELLDWLACRLTENQWSLKRIVRLMVTSKTWQASSTPSDVAMEIDPDNRLWARSRLNRLEAESIRDSLLSVSGAIDLREFGPPVGGNVPRRSIYVNVQRNSLDPFLRVFDFPEPFTATGVRDTTNVPAQSLTVMNSPQVVSAARAWAQRVLADTTIRDDRERIDLMFQAAFGRPAAAEELQQTLSFLENAKRLYQDLREDLERWNAEVDKTNQLIEQIMSPARLQLMKQPAVQDETEPTQSDAVGTLESKQPILAWNFADGIVDSVSDRPLVLSGDARLDNGTLKMQGSGYASTSPLEIDLTAKTLEVWVELDDYNQRGAGVVTLQTNDGNTFDSIVFGEKSPGQWLAGSNFFARTESLEGEVETEASQKPIHLVFVYEDNGRITAYRNGTVYGKPYQSRGLQPFNAGQSILSLGVRHLPAGGNRMLRGSIHQVRLYDIALAAEDVQKLFVGGGGWVTEAMILNQLTSQQREEVARLRGEVMAADAQRQELRSAIQSDESLAIWTDLAHSLLTLPEFIYIR